VDYQIFTKKEDSTMNLWDTKAGDKWLCSYCEKELTEKIKAEGWRLVFQRLDPVLRCANCGHGDFEIDD